MTPYSRFGWLVSPALVLALLFFGWAGFWFFLIPCVVVSIALRHDTPGWQIVLLVIATVYLVTAVSNAIFV